MTVDRVRALFVLLVLACTAALGHWAKPTDHLADHLPKIDLEALFPRQFGDWVIDEHQPVTIVSPDMQETLDRLYQQVLTRTYVNKNGYRIMLSVAYGGDQSKATRAHRPDVCYPVQGFQILGSEDAEVTLPRGPLPVRHMTAQLAARIEPVTFWFAVGELTAISTEDQKHVEWTYGLKGLIPDGMLVRVSSIDPDIANAYAAQARFIREMHAAFPAAWTPRVFGAAVGTK